VRYLLLGPLEARDGDRPVALGPGRQRALLAVLLLDAGRAVPVARLVDDLWGEDVPATAPKMVQILVSQLRKLLPRDELTTRPPGYAIDIPPEALDLTRFECLRRDASAATDRGDDRTASDLLTRALSLWRGPALAEFSEPFARLEGPRLEELRLSALEHRIEADLALGRHAEVVGDLDVLVARHPLRESLRQWQILALYRCRRQADALAAYREARRVLGDELAIEPSPELRRLERAVLRQDPVLDVRPPGATVPAGAAPAPAPVLAASERVVGRERDLGVLAGLHAEARSGRRQVVFLTGEPGIGKTTLAEAFAEAAAHDGETRVARGQCIEHRGAAEPFMPVLEALGRLTRLSGGERVVEVLGEIAPSWLAQMPWLGGGRGPGGPPPPGGRERMLRELLEALDEIAASSPCILLLDDLHWADHSTVDLVEALARRREAARLMLLGTFRPGDPGAGSLGALARDLRAHGRCVEIALEPLGEAEVAALVARGLPAGAAVPGGLADTVRSRTGGNPLFVTTLLNAWLAEGAPAGDGVKGIPETVRDLIEQQLLRLPAESLEALEAASVVGTRFAAAAAAAAAKREPDDLEERCAALARKGLFVTSRATETWPDGTVSARFSFTHDLSREVLEDRIPAGRRAAMHGRIGRRLESAWGERAAEIAPLLASHFDRSPDAERAVRHLAAAADAALRAGANHEAIALLERAVALVGRAEGGDARAATELRLRIPLGSALIASCGYAAAETRANYRRARDLAEELGSGEDALPVLYGLWNNEIVAGHHASALEIATTFLRLAEEGGDPAAAVAHRAVGFPLFFMGRLEEACECFARVPPAAGGHDDDLRFRFAEDPAAAGSTAASLTQWLLGRGDDAMAAGSAAMDRARALDHPLTLVYALLGAALLHQFRGDRDAAGAAASEAAACAADHGIILLGAWAGVVAGWAAPDPAVRPKAIAAALATADSTGAVAFRPHFMALLAEAKMDLGDTVAARRLVRDASDLADVNGERYWLAEIHRLEGDLALADREADPTRAEEAYRAAIAVAADQGARVLELPASGRLSELLRAQGRDDEARALPGV
jgi:DNA-binding SARP family transcriptional activator